jgi:hypothetical protein
MKLKCSQCGFDITGSEDETNDGLCDWCEGRRVELATKRVGLRISKLLESDNARRF